jgi:hypothetical protein
MSTPKRKKLEPCPVLSEREQRRIRKLINKAVAKATNIYSLRCSIGKHKPKLIAQSGKGIWKAYIYVCKRCGKLDMRRLEAI